jgi:hypothetical protein
MTRRLQLVAAWLTILCAIVQGLGRGPAAGLCFGCESGPLGFPGTLDDEAPVCEGCTHSRDGAGQVEPRRDGVPHERQSQDGPPCGCVDVRLDATQSVARHDALTPPVPAVITAPPLDMSAKQTSACPTVRPQGAAAFPPWASRATILRI